MKVKILKDSTLTVKAGQTVNVADSEIRRLLSQGRIAIPKKPEAASQEGEADKEE